MSVSILPGEFELIRQFFCPESNRNADADGVVLGIGDDAAIVRPPLGEELLICTDTMVEGRHFLPDADPQSLGWKLLAVNLSDIAAMGGTPRWATLALTLPMVHTPWLGAFAQGLFNAAQIYGVHLVGGDTTRGPLTLNLTLVGTVPAGQALTRSGAHPGDEIYVSGYPGEAACAVQCLLRKQEALLEHRQRLDTPQPRIVLGQQLRQRATAAIDVSDGLLQDLQHILHASAVGASIDRFALPVRKKMVYSPDLSQILAGGDDYELLFCLPAGMDVALLGHSVPIQRIGTISTEPGLRWQDGGAPIEDEYIRGFQHF